MKIVYESTGQPVGDGMRIVRVSQEGQRMEVLVDSKTEEFVAMLFQSEPGPVDPPIDPPPVEEPEEPPVDPVEPVEPPAPLVNSPDGTSISAKGARLVFGGQTYDLVDATDGRGLGLAVDDIILPETNSITALFVHGGKLYQAAWSLFWERIGAGWGPVITVDPRLPPVVVTPDPDPEPEPEPEPVTPGEGGTVSAPLVAGEQQTFSTGSAAPVTSIV